ncbi:MAG: replication initiator protein [Microviridae sp.]|nr:MAG: replication initiator protein [Microviridae sp.]
MCTSPLLAWQRDNGEVVFSERGAIFRELSLPCGQCMECRLARSRKWAIRCMHEARLSPHNVFATLTYNEQHLPARGQLVYRDFQLFMKRLIKAYGPTRFYMCGEYGGRFGRPHYHALLFGLELRDRVYWKAGSSGFDIYVSPRLSSLWSLGDCFVGDVTFQSAAYVARYCVQKVTGFNAKYYYAREDSEGSYFLQPEFNRMSLRPGIGRGFYERFKSDIYPHDYVIDGGRKLRPPRFYDRLFGKESPLEFERIQFEREREGRSRYLDSTPERLAVRDEVVRARARLLIRNGDA